MKELKDGNVVGSQRPMSTQLSFSAGRRTWVGQNENNLVKKRELEGVKPTLRYVTLTQLLQYTGSSLADLGEFRAA